MSKLSTAVKSHQDPRHLRRIKNMQAIFAYDAGNPDPSTPESLEIISHLIDINTVISQIAPKWPLEKINKVDLAILRCAIWEIKFINKTPPKVIIDEAVELAKEFGTDTSSAFINGCLGGIINQPHEPTTTPTPNQD